MERIQDSARPKDTINNPLIIKFGHPILVYGRLHGMILKQIDSEHYVVSVGNQGVNWKETVHISNLGNINEIPI